MRAAAPSNPVAGKNRRCFEIKADRVKRPVSAGLFTRGAEQSKVESRGNGRALSYALPLTRGKPALPRSPFCSLAARVA
jgi:hypothetical protein